jgi:RND family efflux transporter MFP subunit
MKSTIGLWCAHVIVCICACTAKKQNIENKETFPVTQPITVDTTIIQEFVADIHAVKNVEIRSRIAGFIDKVHMDEGQMVTAGQLLFTINSQELRQELLKTDAQLKNAKADLKIAEVGLDNAKILLEKNIVSEPEVEMAKAKLDAAKAKVEEAESAVSSVQLQISFASVKAPFQGTINRLPLKGGSLVEEGALLTTISNNDEVFAYFNLSEKQFLGLMHERKNKNESKVKLLLADGSLYPFEGRIETAESEFDRNTGNLAFRARFKNNGLLKHGSSGKLQMVSKLNHAMLIPQKATFDVQENTYVYVWDKDKKVSMQRIKVAQRLPHLFVVSEGLTTDDKILYEGIQRVREQDQIEGKYESMQSIMKQQVGK